MSHEDRCDHEQRDTTEDPVCGMTVKVEDAPFEHEHEGQRYHFCSEGCMKKFREDPARYLSKADAEPDQPLEGIPAQAVRLREEIRTFDALSCGIEVGVVDKDRAE